MTSAITCLNEPSPLLNAISTTAGSLTTRGSRKITSLSANRVKVQAPWNGSGAPLALRGARAAALGCERLQVRPAHESERGDGSAEHVLERVRRLEPRDALDRPHAATRRPPHVQPQIGADHGCVTEHVDALDE